MIFDTIDHAGDYAALSGGVAQALAALRDFRPETYRTGRTTLDGDDVFLLANAYETRDRRAGQMEAHRRYLDVMYLLEGREIVYVKPAARLQEIRQPYDPAADALLAALDDDAIPVRLEAGCFLILFPQDAHCPGCCADGPSPVKKVIGKVRVGR